MKIPYYIVILTIYITYMFASADAMVGRTTKAYVVQWYFPWEMFVFLMVPAVLGYLIRREEE